MTAALLAGCWVAGGRWGGPAFLALAFTAAAPHTLSGVQVPAWLPAASGARRLLHRRSVCPDGLVHVRRPCLGAEACAQSATLNWLALTAQPAETPLKPTFLPAGLQVPAPGGDVYRVPSPWGQRLLPGLAGPTGGLLVALRPVWPGLHLHEAPRARPLLDQDVLELQHQRAGGPRRRQLHRGESIT